MTISPRLRRWLTGPASDPSIRLRYWTAFNDSPAADRRVRDARQHLGREGWAAKLLSTQFPDGHWVTPGSAPEELYRPKYISTNWVIIVLAELGMTRTDPRIRKAAELLLDRWSRRGADLDGRSGEICVTGNAVRALLRFGYLDHPAVRRSIDWIVDTQKRDGGWHCFPSRTGTLDSWEGLAALAEIPPGFRTESVDQAIERGAEFFLERRLMREGKTPYPPWFRIHYPNHYYYDALLGLRLMVRLGYAGDRRLRPAVEWLRKKKGRDGTWSLDAVHPDRDAKLTDYPIRTPVFPMMLEPLGEPSRWATLEALVVLDRVGNASGNGP